jgi:hypothetical protein
MSFISSMVSTIVGLLGGDTSVAGCQQPSDAALAEIDRLRTELNTPFTMENHEHLLKELNDIIYVQSKGKYMKEHFEPIGPQWKAIGFQHEDPLKDVRGGGVLSIKNMIYAMQTSAEQIIPILDKRSDRSEGANYPWAAASINVTRMTATLFEVVAPNGFSAVSNHSSTNYWSFLEELDGFNKVYTMGIIKLDEAFTSINGTYMDFPRALQVWLRLFELLFFPYISKISADM